jgi:hypothetical protein
MLQGHTTRVIEDKATSRTVEERLTELVLQAPERPGQGRLRDVQRTRRDAHGAFPLDRLKLPQLFQIHASPLQGLMRVPHNRLRHLHFTDVVSP